jgi:UDP-N-acetylmuramate dehydrogenase
MTPRAQVPLAPYCTMRIGGAAGAFVEATDEATVRAALEWTRQRSVPLRVLGGGSNLVIADEGIDGLVLMIGLRGVTSRIDGDAVEVTAAAGEPWDDFVGMTVSLGLAGLECLSGIPGLVGATPIQNVGAYGQDVSETVSALRVLDRRT